MITKRGLILLILAIVSYVAVLIVDIPAFMEVTGIFGTLLVACFLYTWVTSLGLGATLRGPRQGVLGEDATLRLTVYNRWLLPRFGLLWRVHFPPGGQDGTFVWTWVDRLGTFGEREVCLEATCRQRGRHEVGPVVLVYSDPLGLFSLERRFKSSFQIEVLPAFCELDAFPFIESGAGFRDPEKTMPTPGFSNDFYAIRPYEHGDSPRWIHWLSTVRMQQLMTRQFQAPIQRRVLLVMDCSRPPLPMLGSPAAFELAVSAAASIVRFAAQTEHEVGLLTLSRKPLTIMPASGMDNVRQMISVLAGVQQEGRRGRPELGHILVTGIQSLIVVTATPTEGFVQAMQALRGEGINLSVVIAAPQADGARPGKRHPVQLLARHGLAVCHARNMARLKQDLEHPVSIPTAMLPDWKASRSLRKVL